MVNVFAASCTYTHVTDAVLLQKREVTRSIALSIIAKAGTGGREELHYGLLRCDCTGNCCVAPVCLSCSSSPAESIVPSMRTAAFPVTGFRVKSDRIMSAVRFTEKEGKRMRMRSVRPDTYASFCGTRLEKGITTKQEQQQRHVPGVKFMYRLSVKGEKRTPRVCSFR